MEAKKMKNDKTLRYVCLAICELFCVFSIVYAIVCTQEFSKATICLLSVLCLLAPEFAERVFKMHVPTPLYLFVLVYALCPTLGHTYQFYAIIPWWDTLLHATGGVVFAIFGAYLPKLLQKDGKCNLLVCAIFGLLFSMSVAVVWEIIEFSSDQIFNSDMQQDTIINGFNSYALGNGLEIRHVYDSGEIVKTVLYGQNDEILWEIAGYIDTGILDTMEDMIWETVGAVVYTVALLADKGRHLALCAPSVSDETDELYETEAEEEEAE